MNYRHDAPYPSRRSPVLARNVVTTSQPLATQAGLSMLHRGGNAVDAILATAITLTVVEPTGNGLGSDAFCILWDGKELHGLNASGKSPKGWTPERFAGRKAMDERGWESVTVPGAVSAWVALSERFGKLDFPTLFEPAIRYAEEGFLVSPIIGTLWRLGGDLLGHQPGFADHFLPGGKAPAPGAVFKSAALARTLRLIAETEGEAFYRGELAERIAAWAKKHDAALDEDDLAAHEPYWCGTIHQGFRDVQLHEIPPNGQGISALMALGMLEHAGIDRYEVDSADALHLQIEAMKLAFRDLKAYVADPGHMRDVTAKDLLSADYLASRAKLIDPRRATDFKAGAPKAGGTVYLSAGDESGMMVSYIQSNYSGFGSGVVVPETGISLQNRGSGFSLTPGHPNEVGPAKRPFHTIIPGFLMKGGEPLMSFGVMGGPIQPQGHVQMTLRTQLWDQDPQTSADAPRWRVMEGLDVAIEAAAGDDVLNELAARGHKVTRETADATSFGFGGAQLVHKVEGGYAAGSDPRKDGQAAGF
ncbi:gamma-glutamyltransferase family protein [Lutibaculum baratangense]|uniref:Gamma-glutamyltranspeptidase n=1 Tax=Lutibaculum baratangense AMV1 TaxID=631454 RepID=V4RQ13_9HYPH|nr:gamma-glutamyltransferase family protein [Lutibaculum baratangense]ESR25275.1 Gamma-glutamyltranspeptidase [Lutibaculum baratangense AMV1]